jgi:hypothetical protein
MVRGPHTMGKKSAHAEHRDPMMGVLAFRVFQKREPATIKILRSEFGRVKGRLPTAMRVIATFCPLLD